MNINLMKKVDYLAGVPLCQLLGRIYRAFYPAADMIAPQQASKILLIKTWGIGNLVMMLPVMKAIRRECSRAKIVLLTLEQNKGIMERSPYIDSMITLNLSSASGFGRSSARALSSIRAEKFDLVLDFDQFSRIAALFALGSGAPARIGFDTDGQGKGTVFTKAVKYEDRQHMALTYAKIAQAAGISVDDMAPVRLPLSEKEEMVVGNFLSSGGVGRGDLLFGMHPGSGDNFPERRWPKECFARLADLLAERFKARIVLTGGRSEAGLVREVANLMKAPAIEASGVFSALELSALVGRCDLFFSNDTSLIHITTAMGTPAIGFYGPNTPLLYGPRGDHDLVFYRALLCSPCMTNFNAKSSNCKDPACIRDISPDEVYRQVMNKYSPDPRRFRALRQV